MRCWFQTRPGRARAARGRRACHAKGRQFVGRQAQACAGWLPQRTANGRHSWFKSLLRPFRVVTREYLDASALDAAMDRRSGSVNGTVPNNDSAVGEVWDGLGSDSRESFEQGGQCDRKGATSVATPMLLSAAGGSADRVT